MCLFILTEEVLENGPRRWPAAIGLFLYFSHFVSGLCTDHKYNQYMIRLGQDLELTDNQIRYIQLLVESEREIAKALYEFSELEFPLNRYYE